jgi:hypothetical protein
MTRFGWPGHKIYGPSSPASGGLSSIRGTGAPQPRPAVHQTRCPQEGSASGRRSRCRVAAAETGHGAPHRARRAVDRQDAALGPRGSAAHPDRGRDRRPGCLHHRQPAKAAAFPVVKTLDGFDVSASSIPQATVDYLSSLEWIRAQQNLAIIGPPGTGKSHTLIGLGHAAVTAGHKVHYFTATDLIEVLYRGLADNTVGKIIDTLLRAELVIIDEIGFAPLVDTGTQLLFRLVAAAYERRSLAVASHWPFEKAHLLARTCA